MLELQLAMASLVYSLIEENGPKELAIAKVFLCTISLVALRCCEQFVPSYTVISVCVHPCFFGVIRSLNDLI